MRIKYSTNSFDIYFNRRKYRLMLLSSQVTKVCDGKCIFLTSESQSLFFSFLWTHLLVDPNQMCTSGSGSSIMRIRRDCWGLGNSLRTVVVAVVVLVVVVVTVVFFFLTLLKPNYINQLKTKVLQFFRLLRREHLKKRDCCWPFHELVNSN